MRPTRQGHNTSSQAKNSCRMITSRHASHEPHTGWTSENSLKHSSHSSHQTERLIPTLSCRTLRNLQYISTRRCPLLSPLLPLSRLQRCSESVRPVVSPSMHFHGALKPDSNFSYSCWPQHFSIPPVCAPVTFVLGSIRHLCSVTLTSASENDG